MKKRSFVMTSLLLLALMAAAQVARAQDNMVVNIPFAFVAGKATLPAGEYLVQNPESGPAVILIHRTIPDACAVFVTMPTSARDPLSASKLVFNRYGDRYFLSQIWKAGYLQGKLLSKSPREKELTRLARIEKAEVTLVARLTPANP